MRTPGAVHDLRREHLCVAGGLEMNLSDIPDINFRHDYRKAVGEMKDLEEHDDGEQAHSQADAILCEVLKKLGLSELVEAWEKVPKWYA